MDPNDITVIVKVGHCITDYDFYILHKTYPLKTEYLEISVLTFEHNLIYLN